MRRLGLLVFIAACHSDPAIDSIAINPTHARAGETITMTLEVSGLELTYGIQAHALRTTHGEETQGGHIHVYFDSVDVNPLVQTGSTTIPLIVPVGASSGAHTLIARLHGGDHTILVPEVRAEVPLTVDP